MTDEVRRESEGEVALGATRSLESTSAGNLTHLRDLDDVHVAEGNPDIRGWEVRSDDGRKLGEIDGLLVDTGAMKVRYVELKLDDGVAAEVAREEGETDPRIEPSRYRLVPIGLLRLDESHDVARLSGEAADASAREADGASFSTPLFDERLCFGPRWRSTGSAGYLRAG